ncbi:hypothetical protein TNCV_3005121 [Trichonephila clavipes]|nr:hypothetical protein TNCV_3005121 [Trichonephila clavipes]
MAVMDHAATSRTIAQQIQSFTHSSVSACTFDFIFSRVDSPRDVHCFVYPSLETTGVYVANSAMNGGHGQRNGTALLKNTTSACKITMVIFEFRDNVEGGC